MIENDWEERAKTILKMYITISDGLIAYLKTCGMEDPHPSKEFIMQLVEKATMIGNDQSGSARYPNTYGY